MFVKADAENGVVFYKSSLIDVPHGFSTRIGGVSTLSHTSSLNLAFGRGDDEKTVLSNLSLFAEAVGVDSKSVTSLPQIHSSDIIDVSYGNRGEGYYKDLGRAADGYILTEVGTAAGVKTADCVPVLLYDKKKNIAAAVHAGWRGTALSIAMKAVEKMVSLGSKREDIYAAIGPAIGGCCYEVGEEVRAETLKVSQELSSAFSYKDGSLYYGIKEANRIELILSGLKIENIDLCPYCTYCEKELFYSHRRDKGVRGTMLSLISLPDNDESR